MLARLGGWPGGRRARGAGSGDHAPWASTGGAARLASTAAEWLQALPNYERKGLPSQADADDGNALDLVRCKRRPPQQIRTACRDPGSPALGLPRPLSASKPACTGSACGSTNRSGALQGRMRQLVAALGDPQDKVPVVHVAGTKGKGSVAAFLSAAVLAGGYKVGTYTRQASRSALRLSMRTDLLDLPAPACSAARFSGAFPSAWQREQASNPGVCAAPTWSMHGSALLWIWSQSRSRTWTR